MVETFHDHNIMLLFLASRENQHSVAPCQAQGIIGLLGHTLLTAVPQRQKHEARCLTMLEIGGSSEWGRKPHMGNWTDRNIWIQKVCLCDKSFCSLWTVLRNNHHMFWYVMWVTENRYKMRVDCVGRITGHLYARFLVSSACRLESFERFTT